MNSSIISTRYAKALLLVGIEHNCLEKIKDDMDLLYVTINENPVFEQLLDSPVVKPVQKHRVMDELLAKKVHPMTVGFIHVLIKNKRDPMLHDITRRFIRLYETHKGIKHARITSAIALDERIEESLVNKLNELCHARVQLTSEVDSGLIGGFILRVDDRQYDASLASSLQRIKKEMAK
ncbi:MAG: ATP synthase F1 subunit delta [Bacteroidales bacterium]|jgi:F-type H+-transporting ATPase subunit delta|nr:ATP synthase F1 subunit delta [Bacteroidales bacterium]